VLEFGHITPEVPQIQCSRDPVGIFLGSDNPINVAALNWFVSAVMPVLQRQVPGFKLKVVGSACNAIGDMNGVDKLGFVDDLTEAFSQACVNINPVFMGTGVNIKLLDAMMHGMPCICSATGARGLEQYAGEGVCIVADGDALGFANAVIEHLNDPALRAKSANEARAAALSWNRRQQESLSSWVAHVRSRRI
jgi:glycosyltransferase involved in cell wall biosynthesis